MNYFILFIIFSFISCETHRPKSNEIETVNFEKNYQKPVLNTSSVGADIYGPKSDEGLTSIDEDKAPKTPILTLNLTPALYQSLAYAKLFASLEKNKIKPSIIMTSGFSAIICALYGKYLSASRLDWKIYALGREIKDTDNVFTSDWYQKIEDFLKEEFGNMKLEELKFLLALPIKKANGGYELKYSGSIVSVLMENLKLENNTFSLLTNPSNKYIGLEKEFGADLIFNITALPKRIKLSSNSGFVLGVYSKLAGYIHFKGDEYYVLQEDENVNIDEFPNISDLMSSVSPQTDLILEEILKSIDSWTNKIR